MEIFINNKTYLGKYDENDKLIIPLDNNEDILFFQQWVNQLKPVMKKKDYVKDFDYENGYEKGTLCSCRPLLSKNLDYVELVYDFKDGGLILPCN